ncbi:MAG: hypothetical protein HXS48_16560 [Theionarchaea archaeon]|nr:hypothetical protein [Theionarchaea archaeon]
MWKKVMISLVVTMLLSCSFLVCEGPRGPLCNPFSPSVENHIWFWWPEGIAGFEFDDKGNFLYIVDGIPSQYGELISSSVQKEFQMLPLTGEFTYWHPIKEGGIGGFWLKHYAVKKLKQPWGTVYPGVDFEYKREGGKHITEATREDLKYFKDQPFDPPLEDYVWKMQKNGLQGIQFDKNGYARYIAHGIPGTYSLNDVPLSGEYTVWYPVHPESEEGYWLKHVAVKEFRMPWGRITPGVDLNYTSEYNLKDLTKKSLTGYKNQPFYPPLKYHAWKKENDHLYGFQFDRKGKLLYIIDGIAGTYSLDDVPYSGEYTVWRPVNPTSSQGYWLRYTAVTTIEMPWEKITPGVNYDYYEGKSIEDLPKDSTFTLEPFTDSALKNHIWKRKGDELYGAQFDEKGDILYLVHGLPGTYSLNDVPLSGEYVVWFPIKEGAEEGFWLKYTAVSEFKMEWGHVTHGIDLYYHQEEGRGISWLTRDHYKEGWDLRKLLKYFWSLINQR